VKPTYETLAARAERALLGALLLRPDAYQDIAYLDPAQFVDPANAALFEAVRTELTHEPDQTISTLTAHLQAVQAATGTSSDLASFIETCPDPTAATAYARILVEAELNRTMAAHAARLVELSEPHSPERSEAAALIRPERAISQDAENAPIPGSWKGSRPNREERILADLIQHPDQIEQAREAINATTFTSTAREDLLEALSAVQKCGEPTDTLTIAWEFDRVQAESYRNVGVDPAAYIDRLAAVPVVPGTALATAQQIASEEQRVAERQARAPQPASPTNGATVADRSVDRRVGRRRDVDVRPPSHNHPTPGTDRHGPRLGH
jgi:replicative DNA helicase